MKGALLGAGAMASVHAAAYEEMSDVSISVVYSRELDKARAVADRLGAAATSDLDEAMKADVDFVDICLPSRMHGEAAASALTSGKHVLCETPFTSSLSEADELIVLAAEKKLELGIGLLMPWVSELSFILAAAKEGRWGDLVSVSTRRHSPPYREPGSHHADALLELGAFDFVFLDQLCGIPRTIRAAGSHTSGDLVDAMTAVLTYDGGVSATVEVSARLPATLPYRSTIELLFSKGVVNAEFVISFDGPPVTKLVEEIPEHGVREIPVQPKNPYVEEIRHFVRYVGDPAGLGAMDAVVARRALALDRAARESMRSGRALNLDS